jgi:hypothetical protein
MKVYIATDDPDGVCFKCEDENKKPCPVYDKNRKNLKPLPFGCLEDPTWTAFSAVWNIRFLGDFIKRGVLDGINPHAFPFLEVIASSRAKKFAGTYFSTFTGYIHRLRGYHGLGEESYYHTPARNVFSLQMSRSVGSGWMREWRGGWTDDGGDLI